MGGEGDAVDAVDAVDNVFFLTLSPSATVSLSRKHKPKSDKRHSRCHRHKAQAHTGTDTDSHSHSDLDADTCTSKDSHAHASGQALEHGLASLLPPPRCPRHAQGDCCDAIRADHAHVQGFPDKMYVDKYVDSHPGLRSRSGCGVPPPHFKHTSHLSFPF